MLMFAYGANTNINSMTMRCPDADYVGGFTLPDWRLVFRGVADIEPEIGSEVLGVLWDITPKCERSLDRFEGYPRLYGKEYFAVSVDGNVEDVMFYKMNSNGYHLPADGYLKMINEGYRYSNLDLDPLYEAVRFTAREEYRG